MQPPLVSVVTPTLNAGRFLKDTIDSVLGQDYPSIEFLVVDSDSTDDTHEILRLYEGRLRIIQAPHSGPASAIHLGLCEARGSIVTWLNADDQYEPDAVSSAVQAFQENPEADIVYGGACWTDQNGVAIRPYPTIPFDAAVLSRDCFISQPAAFFRASIYRECPLDPSLPVSFDYDLWIRWAARGRRFQYMEGRLASSRMHSDCLTLSHRLQVFEVTMGLLKRHYGYIPLSWVFGYLSYRYDGRDQFFQPLRKSISVFAASLPLAIARNPSQPFRVIRDWISAARRGFWQYLASPPGEGTAAHTTGVSLLTEPPARDVGPVAANRRG